MSVATRPDFIRAICAGQRGGRQKRLHGVLAPDPPLAQRVHLACVSSSRLQPSTRANIISTTVAGSAHGHWWTITPDLLGRLRPQHLVDAPWSVTLTQPEGGEGPCGTVRLAGWLGGPGDADLFVLVHGFGGDADRPYLRKAAATLQARGLATLRLSLRGAGNSSPDFFHAGLGSDVAAAISDPSLARHPRVFVMGYSLGGHIAAHLALRSSKDPRLAGIIMVCAPLDLARNVELLDRPSGWLYRRFVLNSLELGHARVHGHSPRFRSIRDWDAMTVVPRYGFESVEQYWSSQCAGPRLREAGVPILFIATEADPMVPAETLMPHLRRAGAVIDVRWLRRGGHIGFPTDTDLGLPGERGLFNQILSWCERV
jgi:predicted alpha/beta-fold hydrolase